jgi:hypothetical protein
MVGFVIPIRAKEKSRNWVRDVELLERTVKSVLNQTDPDLRLVVVCSDIPDISVQDSRLRFLQYPFPFLQCHEISDYETYGSRHYDPPMAEGVMDQGRKISFGCMELIREHCDYIMPVDHDDLVSNRLTSFVHSVPKESNPGWYVDKGYIHKESRNYVIRRNAMNEINGSTHIIRQDLIDLPSVSSHSLWENNFFTAHGYVRTRILRAHHAVIQPIPFPATIYSANENNWSNINEIMEFRSLRGKLKRLLHSRRLTGRIRKEFGLYDISQG